MRRSFPSGPTELPRQGRSPAKLGKRSSRICSQGPRKPCRSMVCWSQPMGRQLQNTLGMPMGIFYSGFGSLWVLKFRSSQPSIRTRTSRPRWSQPAML